MRSTFIFAAHDVKNIQNQLAVLNFSCVSWNLEGFFNYVIVFRSTLIVFIDLGAKKLFV